MFYPSLSSKQALFWLLTIPMVLLLPVAFEFGAVTMGDHELIAKLGLFTALKNGDSICWSEALDCGTLLLGSTSVPLTVGDLLYLILNYRWAHNLSHIIDIILAGFGFYLWRVYSSKSKPMSALLGAITYQLSLHPIAQLSIGHQLMSAQYALLPWALWCIDELLRKHLIRFLAVFPWLIFLMAMATYPVTTIALGMVVAFYLIWYLIKSNEKFYSYITMIMLFAGGTLLGLGFAAFVYIPTIEFSHYCVLPGNLAFNIKDYAYHFSLPIPCITTLALPYLFGGRVIEDSFWSHYMSPAKTGGPNEFALYSGLIPLWLFWVNQHSLLRLQEIRFWLFTGIILLLISFGKWGGLYPIIHHLPVLANLRGPCRFTIALPIVFACLATIGSELWNCKTLEEQQNDIMQLLRIVISLISISFVILGLSIILDRVISMNLEEIKNDLYIKIYKIIHGRIILASATNLQIISFLGLTWGVILFFTKISASSTLKILCLLAAVDLGTNAYPALWKPSGNYTYYLKPHPLSLELQNLTNHGHTRFASYYYSAPHNLALLDGTEDVSGFKDFVLQWHVELLRKLNGENPFTYDLYGLGIKRVSSPLFSLLRVDTLVSQKPIMENPWHEVRNVDSFHLYQGMKPAPMAWIPDRIKVVEESNERLKCLEQEVAYAPTKLALVEKTNDSVDLQNKTTGSLPRVIRKKGLNYEIIFDRPTTGLLCTTIGFYPNWIALSDHGQSLKVLKVNHAFVGVKLNRPISKVIIQFVPRAHQLGAYLSTVFVALWGGVIGICLYFSAKTKRIKNFSIL